MNKRNLSIAFISVILVLFSCTKAGREELQAKTPAIPKVQTPTGSNPSEQIAMTGLTELTEIEPGIYWCYYGGISMKFKNLVYQVATQTSPAVYADLFWVDPSANCNIELGGNFSRFFVINESYCANMPQTTYYVRDTSLTLTGSWQTMWTTVNGVIPYGNPETINLGAGVSFSIAIIQNTAVSETFTFKYYTLTVPSTICGQWAYKKIMGKLFTQLVNGVRKFYVAPMNYPDPVLPPLE